MLKVFTDTIEQIFAISKRDNIPTYVAADRLAEERIARVAKSRSQFLQNEKSIIIRKIIAYVLNDGMEGGIYVIEDHISGTCY